MQGHGTEYHSSDDDFKLWLQGDGDDGNHKRWSGETADETNHVPFDFDGDEGNQDTGQWSDEAM